MTRRLGQWGSWRPRQLLVAAVIMLVPVVTAVDIMAPPESTWGRSWSPPPAITASFAGVRTTAFVGGVAQILVAGVRTTPLHLNHSAQIATPPPPPGRAAPPS
ncbi:hypothetical protein [Actinacidiphila glaucinigra]|uniref:hypothetical protein n=1 Tax=Actinacidiphila glaucinigra TaxID=235986 RepID=UPI003818616E